MAGDEINSSNSVLPIVLPTQVRISAPLATTPLNNILNPVPVAVVATQDLTPAQQSALLVNETLQGLNFLPSSPGDALLINETSPSLTTFVETLSLSPAQQAALTVNETLQTLATPSALPQSTIPAVAAGNVAQGLTVRSNSSKSNGLKSRLGSCPYAPVA